MKLMDNTPSIDDLKVADFDAIVVVGGQSPMFTFGSAKNTFSSKKPMIKAKLLLRFVMEPVCCCI